MPRRFWVVPVIVTAFWTSAMLPGATCAQDQAPSNVAFDSIIDVKGTLKAAQKNILTVTRSDGEEVTVMLHEDPTKMRVMAEAKPAFLRPQMLVRLTANLGPAGVPTTPVDRIEVFQPIPLARLPGSVKERYTPGMYASDKAHAAQQRGFVPGNYSIVGTIAGMETSGLYVFTGTTRVPVPLAPDAKIYLVFNNLSLAQPGDPVTVKGFYQPPDETKVMANDVTIRPDRVYGEASEDSPRATRGRGRARARTAEPAPAEAAPAEAAAEQP